MSGEVALETNPPLEFWQKNFFYLLGVVGKKNSEYSPPKFFIQFFSSKFGEGSKKITVQNP